MIGIYGIQKFDHEIERAGINDLKHPLVREYTLSKSLVSAKKTAVNSATVLLATGSTSLSGRSVLIVRNVGTVRAVIGNQSVTITAGEKIDPGETIVFNFDPSTTVDLYARSCGYSADLEASEG